MRRDELATSSSPLLSVIAVCVVASYIAAQMLADIGSLRVVTLLGLSNDAGTLIYPLTFTLRDLVHKTLGVTAARTLIFAAAVINLVMAGFFWLVAQLPADPEVGPQLEFGMVLSPVWRITVASIVAEVVAELTDTEVYERFVRRFGDRYQWGRVATSNIVATPVDTAIFATVAWAGTLPAGVILDIVLSNLLFKFGIAIAFLWLIYLVPRLQLEPLPAATRAAAEP